MEDALTAAIFKTDEVLRDVWAREVSPPPKICMFSVGFECPEEVGERILSFIAEQPTWRRSFRKYEVGSEDGREVLDQAGPPLA